MSLTPERKDEVIEAARAFAVAARFNERYPTGDLSPEGEALYKALNPSPLPSTRDLVRLYNGDVHAIPPVYCSFERVFAAGLRRALKRFGHQEGCDGGCAACDVIRWAEEMEARK